MQSYIPYTKMSPLATPITQLREHELCYLPKSELTHQQLSYLIWSQTLTTPLFSGDKNLTLKEVSKVSGFIAEHLFSSTKASILKLFAYARSRNNALILHKLECPLYIATQLLDGARVSTIALDGLDESEAHDVSQQLDLTHLERHPLDQRIYATDVYDCDFDGVRRVWVSPVEVYDKHCLIALITKSPHEQDECLEGVCHLLSLSQDRTHLIALHV